MGAIVPSRRFSGEMVPFRGKWCCAALTYMSGGWPLEQAGKSDTMMRMVVRMMGMTTVMMMAWIATLRMPIAMMLMPVVIVRMVLTMLMMMVMRMIITFWFSFKIKPHGIIS